MYQTDKSGQMCLDAVENYTNCMQEHVEKDSIITPCRVREGEVLINNNSRTWVRLAKIGAGNQHMWRVNRALVTNHSTSLPLIGLRKDNKANINDNQTLGLCVVRISATRVT